MGRIATVRSRIVNHADINQQIAQEQQIKAMPTFILYKNGEKVETVTGAVPAKLTVSHLGPLLPYHPELDYVLRKYKEYMLNRLGFG